MSEKNKAIVTRSIDIKWPCGHQLVDIQVIVSREDRRMECPFCLLKNFIACYEDDKEKLDEKWSALAELAQRIIDNPSGDDDDQTS